MIPRIYFTYWEGNQLSKLHYYTIYSLTKLNPDMEIIIYTSKEESSKFVQWESPEHSLKIYKTISLEEITNINNNVKLVKIDFEKEHGINNKLSCVFKADFVRILKLYEHGGMWFDFDLLFITKIPEYLFEGHCHNILYFTYENVVPTGLLLSTPKNDIIKNLYLRAKDIILKLSEHTYNNNYQVLGPTLWTKHILHNPEGTYCLRNTLVYPYTWTVINQFFESNNNYISSDTFAIHWYNGGASAKNYINNFNEHNIDPNKCVINQYLHNILTL
jgi:hypothetical protein